ncbi:3-oxoacyl-reductase [Paraphoma chrysanthemicola]|uniref:3-oxoacyl-reductase n=1 Tax=Paraphoma chrysanthemicola TaxID=798071 RepID=A0A8K0W563_9PLEO|nr:3-oxoacyl-reductase [Paraphoma chrysanthemicola]
MATHPPHVLITGGSRGIGLAIAHLFAKKAYRCTLIARSEETLKNAVLSLHPLPNPSSQTSSQTPDNMFQHSYISGDITHQTPPFWSTSPTSPFSQHLPRPPSLSNNQPHPSRIDILVNCAGITQSSLFIKTSHEDLHSIVATNLTAMMTGTKFLMRQGYLRGQAKKVDDEAKGDGYVSPVVINVASLLGISGGYGAVAYAASKAGVLGFTRALAAEYASHRVRVNAIVPGYVTSDMTTSLDSEALRQRIPLGRFGTAEEIAQAALFLVQNEYAHNCVLNLDGGLSAV